MSVKQTILNELKTGNNLHNTLLRIIGLDGIKLLAILIKTNIQKDKTKWFSLTQKVIYRKTGLYRDLIIDSIKSLVDNNIINTKRDGKCKQYFYHINYARLNTLKDENKTDKELSNQDKLKVSVIDSILSNISNLQNNFQKVRSSFYTNNNNSINYDDITHCFDTNLDKMILKHKILKVIEHLRNKLYYILVKFDESSIKKLKEEYEDLLNINLT